MADEDLYRMLLGLCTDPRDTPLEEMGVNGEQRGTKPSWIRRATATVPASPSQFTTLSTLLGLAAPHQLVPRVPIAKKPSASKGMRFQGGYFSEPASFASAWLPPSPGLYAILVIDGSWGPRPYRPLYFGKATALNTRVGSSHEKYSDWCRAAGGAAKLYVSYHLMVGTSDAQRASFERNLISHYSPQCNVTHNFFAEYLGGFSERR